MAMAPALNLASPSSTLRWGGGGRQRNLIPFLFFASRIGGGLVVVVSSRVWRNRRRAAAAAVTPWALHATDNRLLDNAPTSSASTPTIEIPVSCYQIIGVPDQAEKDEIVKAVMQLKSAEIEEGYTMDAVISRQDLLMDVRDKLLFEPEYFGNLKEKILPKSSLRIPWAWLPGALCLLQEVGEEKLVLDIGRTAHQHPNAKPYCHDLLLSMALAECAIAKIGFEKNKVSFGFEALARAQCLLRSKISLEKMALLSQIEQSLEELVPACTLEVLGMSHTPENATRRQGAIAALRELLRQGLDVETSCRVQDWPCFMSQALNRLTAREIVDLLPWDQIALVRKNKKSIESQNLRVVVDLNCFYVVLLAHIALGFSSRQSELISKSMSICECLMASEAIDLKFEEAFCLFLLGKGDEAHAVEKLHQLGSNSNPAARSLVAGKDVKDVSGVKPSLEAWLKDSVLSLFPDTRDISSSFVDFFRGDKGTPRSQKTKLPEQTSPKVIHRPVSDIALTRMDSGDNLPYIKSPQHLGSAVKQLAPPNLESSLIMSKNGCENNVSEPSAQLERNLGAHRNKSWRSWFANSNVIGGMTVVVLGCICFLAFKLSGMNVRRMRIASKLASSKPNIYTSSDTWKPDSSLDYNLGQGTGLVDRMRKLLMVVKKQFGKSSDPRTLQTSKLAPMTISSKQMPAEEAELLVKRWQAVKAEALGPRHQLDCLFEVLDEPMCSQWQDLADVAKVNGCYWRFVLLHLSVLRANIYSDRFGMEMAEIEALIEEAAELVDESQSEKPNYYSTYKVQYVLKRQDGGSWRFCDSDIQTLS